MKEREGSDRQREKDKKRKRVCVFCWVLFGVAGFGASCRGGSHFFIKKFKGCLVDRGLMNIIGFV